MLPFVGQWIGRPSMLFLIGREAPQDLVPLSSFILLTSSCCLKDMDTPIPGSRRL